MSLPPPQRTRAQGLLSGLMAVLALALRLLMFASITLGCLCGGLILLFVAKSLYGLWRGDCQAMVRGFPQESPRTVSVGSLSLGARIPRHPSALLDRLDRIERSPNGGTSFRYDCDPRSTETWPDVHEVHLDRSGATTYIGGDSLEVAGKVTARRGDAPEALIPLGRPSSATSEVSIWSQTPVFYYAHLHLTVYASRINLLAPWQINGFVLEHRSGVRTYRDGLELPI